MNTIKENTMKSSPQNEHRGFDQRKHQLHTLTPSGPLSISAQAVGYPISRATLKLLFMYLFIAVFEYATRKMDAEWYYVYPPER